ncbi:MAG: hypothetical protein K2Q14_03195 [Gammaproteobacteria bacterium]|nr:hypothetical protein [Gammaproteobacteria bacterium]
MNLRVKASLILAILSVSTMASAGAPGNQLVIPTGEPLLAPLTEGVWSFGIEGLYMQQDDNFEYATTGVNTPVTKNESVGNDWDWGGEADLTYLFPNHSSDIRLAYTYLSLNSDDAVSSVLGDVNSFFSAPATINANNGEAKNEETLNQVDLVLGQWMSVGHRVALHPFIGLRYANLDAENEATFSGSGTVPPDSTGLIETDKNTSDLEGVGPRAGIDTTVHLGCGFSVVGTMAGSLIIGDLDSKITYSNYDPATSLATANFTYKPDNYIAVVPELDAQLGLNYEHAMDPATTFDIGAGYQIVNYFGAEDLDFANIADAFHPNTVNDLTSFNYQGFYVRFQLNVA